MKFICDVHIAYKLVKWLKKRGCECWHVNEIFSSSRVSDSEIADYADKHGLIVVTKDLDFRDSYILRRSPKKLLKVNTGNSSTQQMIDLFENNWEILIAADMRTQFFIETDVSNFYIIDTDI